NGAATTTTHAARSARRRARGRSRCTDRRASRTRSRLACASDWRIRAASEYRGEGEGLGGDDTGRRGACGRHGALRERRARAGRDAKFLVRAARSAIVATAVWLALLGLAFALWRATARRLTALAKRHAPRLRVGGGTLISRQRAIEIARRAAALLAYATMIA